jgi:hypothetical protein
MKVVSSVKNGCAAQSKRAQLTSAAMLTCSRVAVPVIGSVEPLLHSYEFVWLITHRDLGLAQPQAGGPLSPQQMNKWLGPAILSEAVHKVERPARIACSFGMTKLDQVTARALVEAGYMPLATYLRMFSEPDDVPQDKAQPREVTISQANLAPSATPAAALPARFATMRAGNYRVICRTRLGSGVRVATRSSAPPGKPPKRHSR